MREILVAGAGKIGTLIACLLSDSEGYSVHLADVQTESINIPNNDACKNIKIISLDVTKTNDLDKYLEQNKIETIISSLPYYCNKSVAQSAKDKNVHYFDLTEDTSVTDEINKIAQGAQTAFVPQSGLAPGFISIAANDLMRQFDKIDAVLMRVGALPVHPNNALKYSLTWSTDGLINEYGNTCYGIEGGDRISLQPLGGLETIEIDGLLYEAFNTSGGLGSLAESYNHKVNIMNYKTLRYPGHCEKMRLLMQDLKLNEHRDELKIILERAIPKTNQDVVLVYVAVKGYQNNDLIENAFVKKIYPKTIAGKEWSAIQVTTASSVCALVDIVLSSPEKYKGIVLQEDFSLDEFLNNRFGQYYT
jgi:saccharopine dehydrogenase-like NADP-dependent oxidoreductase